MADIALVPNGCVDEIHKIGCRDIGKREWFTFPANEIDELISPKIMNCAKALIKPTI